MNENISKSDQYIFKWMKNIDFSKQYKDKPSLNIEIEILHTIAIVSKCDYKTLMETPPFQ